MHLQMLGFVRNKQMPQITLLHLRVIRMWDEVQSTDCSKIKRKPLKSLVEVYAVFKRTRCQLVFAFFCIKTVSFKVI